jgi:arsenite methyltransferase
MKKRLVDMKEIVKQKYGEIVNQSKSFNESSCCGAGSCCGDVDYTIFSEDYTGKQGYNPDADLGLGCGIPTEFAEIKEGNTLVDLGSGAGNDCFVARSIVGDTGHVIGVDFTPEMIEKAKQNAEKLKLSNVEFRYGDIEKMPLAANKADVVISNCVLNLVPDKMKAFSEIFRILKPGGHLCVSDVVLKGVLPPSISEAAEMYAGCVSGAIQIEEYLKIIQSAGFESIQIRKEKQIVIPDDILSSYLNESELLSFKKSGTGIFSITVFAVKPAFGCNGCC